MLDKIRFHYAIEWEDFLEESIGKTAFAFHRKISLLLNIAIPLILLLFFKVNIITFFICFIIFDIIQVVLDYVIYGIHCKVLELTWLFKKNNYKKELEKLSPSEIEELKNNLNDDNSFFKEKLSLINEKIDEYKSLETVVTESSKKTEIKYVEEMIFKFKEYKNIEWIRNYMLKIVETSNKLLSLVKEDEDSISVIINTFNIYSEELLNIISKYEGMDSDQKTKYMPKIEELLNNFLTHLKEQEKKILDFKEHSIDFDIDFLTKKLKEEENKNV